MNNRNNDKNNKSYIFTKETLGMTLMLFSAIVFIMLLTGRAVFAGIGAAICTFMYGTFGYGSYFVVALLAYLGEWLTFGRKINVSLKTVLIASLTVFTFFLLFHAVSTRDYNLGGYGKYIGDCYKNAAKGYSGYTCGGVISALVVYPFAKFTTFIGAYIIFSLLTVSCGYLAYYFLFRGKIKGNRKVKLVKDISPVREEAAVAESVRTSDVPLDQMYEQTYDYVPQREERVQHYEQNYVSDEDKYSQKNLGRKILFEKGEFDAESYRRNMIFNESSYFNHPVKTHDSYLSNFSYGKKPYSVPENQSYQESYQEEVLNQSAPSLPTNYVYGDKPVESLDDYQQTPGDVYSVQQPESYEEVEEEYSKPVIEPVEYEKIEEVPEEDASEPFIEEVNEPIDEVRIEEKPEEKTEKFEKREESQSRTINMYDLFGAGKTLQTENAVEPDTSILSSRRSERSKVNLFEYDDDDEDEIEELDGGFSPLSRSSEETEQRVARTSDAPMARESVQVSKPVKKKNRSTYGKNTFALRLNCLTIILKTVT